MDIEAKLTVNVDDVLVLETADDVHLEEEEIKSNNKMPWCEQKKETKTHTHGFSLSSRFLLDFF